MYTTKLDFSDPTVREAFSSRLEASNFYYKGEEHFGWEWDFSTPTLPRFWYKFYIRGLGPT